MPLSLEQLQELPPADLAARLLEEPEGQWFDRKSARIKPRDLAKSLVAMANAEGGLLAVGLRNGICEGVDARPDAQNEWRQVGFNFTAPTVPFQTALMPCVNQADEADHLLVITVPPSDQMHATTADEVFLRVGDEDRKLSFDQRIQLRYDRGDTSFERTPAAKFGGADLDTELIGAYTDIIGHPDPQRLLQARGLVDKKGTPLVAGHLLFGREPQQIFPEAYIRVLRYDGVERLTGAAQNIAADLRCEGVLPHQIDAAQAAIHEALPKRRSLGPDGRFDWFGIVPEEVWLEALVNAVIHRAYSNFGDHVRVEIFDDRLEVSSPGRFPGISSPVDLTSVARFARNPRIARVMSELSYGQELGEGLRRMVALMESSRRRPPLVQETAGNVRVALLGASALPGALAEMRPLAQQIFVQLEQAGRLRTGELVEVLDASRPTVLKHLYALEHTGYVRRVGSSPQDPGAYWTIGTDA